MVLVVVLVLAIVILVKSEYQLLLDERWRDDLICTALLNSTTLFDGLLPCGYYELESIDLVCLDSDQSIAALNQLNEWSKSGQENDNIWSLETISTGPALKRKFLFENFRDAFYFMTKAAQLAEMNQHHPMMTNFYNTVDVILNTDDKQCLSTFDVELAKGMNIAFKLIAKS